MAIEKIICPELTNFIGEPSHALVKFNDSENPIEIMCPFYKTKVRKCARNGDYNKEDYTDKEIEKLDPCIYSQWKPIIS